MWRHSCLRHGWLATARYARTLRVLVVLLPAFAWAEALYPTALFSPGDVPPTTVLEGHVRISATALESKEHIRAPFLPPTPQDLPDIDVDLVQHGQDLLPVRRGLVTTSHPVFDYFVSPGRVWSENGRARASLPFTLMHRFVNCTHNGVLAFSYSATSIDDVRVLVNQETCNFTKFDLWGEGRATYTPGTVVEADATRAAYAGEVARRVPSRPLTAFAQEHGADLELLLGGLPNNDDLTTAGVYFEGTHYSHGCSTRSGPYPYCEHMLHTSFSTAKTAYPALVLMSLAQQHGMSVYDAKIVDYLPEAKSAKGKWSDVTFNHVGDMTSGNFTNGEPIADAAPGNFYFDLDRAGKLEAALSWPNGAPAGSRFVYQTADTFILVNALDGYLAKHEQVHDSFDYLVATVLKPLGVAPEVMWSRRTRDNGVNNSGTAFGGMGMWWTADAIVKVARFMSIDDGKIAGRQVLHPRALAAALQRDPTDRGIETQVFGSSYNNGTWGQPLQPLGEQFACEPWVPGMTGLSGVRVLMMPNGVVFYYFNDAQAFPLVEAVKAADQVRAFCPKT